MKNCKETRNGHKIILFPLPLQGHINPMMQLANILYCRGFSITIIHTNFNSIESSNYPNFTFHSITDGLLKSEAWTGDIVQLLSNINIKCVEPFRNCLAELMQLDHVSDEEPIACLTIDAILHFAPAIADELKIPTIGLRTSSVCSFLGFAAFPLLRDLGYLPIHECRLEEPVHELPPLRVKDIPLIQTGNPDNFYSFMDKVMKQTKQLSGLIWNTFEELEQDSFANLMKDFPIPMYPIGPFTKHFPASSSSLLPQDQTCISWLDTKPPDSVLYVSFGSLASISKAQFQELAWGLANSNNPFLWVVRPGLVCGSEWLEPLPNGFMEIVGERGCIVKWAPQQKVLAHKAVGGFWTHNGWNSTLESICEGVPMICMPNFGDQMVNARYVCNVWKVGIHLENRIKREDVKCAIKKLMEEEEGHELRKRILQLKDKVDFCPSQEGSSNRSLENLVNYIMSH